MFALHLINLVGKNAVNRKQYTFTIDYENSNNCYLWTITVAKTELTLMVAISEFV